MEVQGQIVMLLISSGMRIVGEHVGDNPDSMTLRNPYIIEEMVAEGDNDFVFTNYVLSPLFFYLESNEISFKDSHIVFVNKVGEDLRKNYFHEVEETLNQLNEKSSKEKKQSGSIVPMKRKN